MLLQSKVKKNSFTLYPGLSRVGRENLVNVKTIRSPLSAEFWRHCMLKSRTQPFCLDPRANEPDESEDRIYIKSR